MVLTMHQKEQHVMHHFHGNRLEKISVEAKKYICCVPMVKQCVTFDLDHVVQYTRK